MQAAPELPAFFYVWFVSRDKACLASRRNSGLSFIEAEGCSVHRLTPFI